MKRLCWHHSSEVGGGQRDGDGRRGERAAAAGSRLSESLLLPNVTPDPDLARLQFHQMRHFDPTPGQWLSEEPVGFGGDDENLVPYDATSTRH